MKVKSKRFSSLANSDTCDYSGSTAYDLADGQTVEDPVQRAGIARQDVKIAFVNIRKVDFDTVLTDGDQIGLVPAVVGM